MDYSGTENGLISVYERFLDSETNNYLGGTIETTINGVTQPASELNAEEDYFPGDEPSFVIGITPSGAGNIALTYEGTESVTVSAGEYPDATYFPGNSKRQQLAKALANATVNAIASKIGQSKPMTLKASPYIFLSCITGKRAERTT